MRLRAIATTNCMCNKPIDIDYLRLELHIIPLRKCILILRHIVLLASIDFEWSITIVLEVDCIIVARFDVKPRVAFHEFTCPFIAYLPERRSTHRVRQFVRQGDIV